MKAHPSGFMTQEVKELINGAKDVLKDMKRWPPNFTKYYADKVEVERTIAILERALKDLNRLARTYEKVVKEVKTCL